METITLAVEPRQALGKEESGRLRRNGRVPGIFYGPSNQATSLSFDGREFQLKIGGLEGSHLIQLTSPHPALQDKIVILKEIQRHPVTSNVLHVDLYEVDVNKTITVTVPLHFIGKAEGVTAGGILQSLMREISVECLPRNIPEFMEIDVSHLKINDSIHIADIVLPQGVTAVFDTNEAVVTVAQPMTEAQAAPEEGEAGAAEQAAAPAEGEQK
ncbi:MAG: 50S ribosomal protein L25 [Candidatus Binatia bacterium]